MASALTHAKAVTRLTEVKITYGASHSLHTLICHPQRRTRELKISGRSVLKPLPPFETEWDDPIFRSRPSVDKHSELPVPARVPAN